MHTAQPHWNRHGRSDPTFWPSGCRIFHKSHEVMISCLHKSIGNDKSILPKFKLKRRAGLAEIVT